MWFIGVSYAILLWCTPPEKKSWIRPCLIKMPGIKTLWQRRKLVIAKTLTASGSCFLVVFHCFSLVFALIEKIVQIKYPVCMSSFQISSRWIWKCDEAPSLMCCIPKNSENKLREDVRWTYLRKVYYREILRSNTLKIYFQWRCIWRNLAM